MSVGKISSTQEIREDRRTPQELLSDDAGPSWQSRCIIGLLRLLPIKKRLASAAAVQEHVRRLGLRPASYEPQGLGRGVEVTSKSVAGWPVYYTAPSKSPDVGNYVVFLHGGGYINEIVRAHWRFVAYLTRHARVRCVVPIYPLAPRATAKDVVPAMGDLLRKLLEEAGLAKVTVIGNSAGAGLGLAATQWLRDSGYPQPNGLVLISPGLNASVSRAEQMAIAARDPVQDFPGIIEAGRLYAGDLDVSHPYVSPLNGDFRGLAPMIVFSGTLDLLYPDSIDLAAKARAAGVPIELHLRQGQPHNYAAMPTPEGRQARAIILRVVAQGLTGSFVTKGTVSLDDPAQWKPRADGGASTRPQSTHSHSRSAASVLGKAGAEGLDPSARSRISHHLWRRHASKNVWRVCHIGGFWIVMMSEPTEGRRS
jgi:acetyl esterase/lipase